MEYQIEIWKIGREQQQQQRPLFSSRCCWEHGPTVWSARAWRRNCHNRSAQANRPTPGSCGGFHSNHAAAHLHRGRGGRWLRLHRPSEAIWPGGSTSSLPRRDQPHLMRAQAITRDGKLLCNLHAALVPAVGQWRSRRARSAQRATGGHRGSPWEPTHGHQTSTPQGRANENGGNLGLWPRRALKI